MSRSLMVVLQVSEPGLMAVVRASKSRSMAGLRVSLSHLMAFLWVSEPRSMAVLRASESPLTSLPPRAAQLEPEARRLTRLQTWLPLSNASTFGYK
jgi:hypothetical protein